MRQNRIRLLLIASVLGSLSSLTLAGTVSYRTGLNDYAGTQDVGITTQNAASWNGFNGNTSKIGNYGVSEGSYQSRGLLRFNNLSLPQGATLTRATLTVTVGTWTKGFKILGYYLSSAWDPTSPKLGWRNRTSASTWLADGTGTADVLPNPPFVLNNFKGAGTEQRTLDLDLSVVADWIGNPASNQGLVLVNDSANKSAYLVSAEDSVVANRPMLTLSYLPAGQSLARVTREDPEPAGINCLYTGTAVRTGPDFDGDGVLADTEVQATVYRCKEPFTQAGPYAGATVAGKGGRVTFQGGVNGYVGTQDVMISNDGAASWGNLNGYAQKSGGLLVANRANVNWNSLIRFDGLAGVVPPGAVVTRAELVLNVVSASGNGLVRGRYLKTTWNPAAANLGWLRRSDTATWANPGGVGLDTDLQPDPGFTLNLPPTGRRETVTVGLDPARVQEWIRSPATNQGLILTADQDQQVMSILSAEDPTPANRPLLVLSYLSTDEPPVVLTREDPEPAGTNCLYAGTAVRSGPDLNGNGELASSEVQTTNYRCNEPFTQTGAYAGAKTAGNGGLVTFQAGVMGYVGVQDVMISNDGAAKWGNLNGYAQKSGDLLIANNADVYWNSLIRFDGLASMVPPGAIVTKAELVLNAVHASGNGQVRGRYLKTTWNPAAANLGWLRRSDTATWATPGGVGLGTDLQPDPGFTLNLPSMGHCATVTVGLDPARVQEWIRSPATNQGLILTVDQGQPVVGIRSAEDPTPANRPMLRLSYQTGTVALTPLTRVDAEPRGVNCKWGGQATRHGLDFDGSGTLSNDEVQRSTYRCDAALVYVAPDGVDTWTWGADPLDGTASKPFATIGFATRYIDDGGTVIVRPGTYHGQVRPEGYYTQGILVKSEIPYAAKLRNSEMVIFMVGGSGITLEGFDIAHEKVAGKDTGPLLVHLDWYAHDVVLRNNIIHDSLNNDSLKINGGSNRVLVEGNIFYNAVAEQIRMDTVADVIIQDNVFFQDFAGAGRTQNQPPGSYIEVADQDGGPLVKSRNVTIRRNVFLNWENSYGANFVQLGGDLRPWPEASYVLIENNLMIGNNTAYRMRAPFGCKGAEYALFRNNTLVGDMYATAFLARLNMEPGGTQNNYILMYNNVIADTAGTMARLTTTPWNDTRAFALDHNLYWNNGRPIPEDAMELINPSDDPNAVLGNPGFASQAGIVLPRWNEQRGKFLDGSSTIAEVHHRLAWTYGMPDPKSAVIDATNPDFAPTHDIFRHARPTGLADLGAVEVEAQAESADPDFDDGSADFSGAGWNPADYDLGGIIEPPPVLDHVTGRPAWYETADQGKPGELFVPGNPWNVDAYQAPLEPNSAKVIQAFAKKGFGLGHMQVDFGLRVLSADAATPYRTFVRNSGFATPDCDYVPMPVPPDGSISGVSSYSCASDSEDCDLLVYAPATHSLYEMWRANITSDGTLVGGCTVVWKTDKLYGPSLRGDQCTSADAGGFPKAAMVFSADEVASGAINHAIRFILPNDRIRAGVYVYPATHGTRATTGDPYDVPYGGRLRLRADYPIHTLKPGAQVVARALQHYGMILADGGQVALTAADDRSTVHKWSESYGGYRLLDPHDLVKLQPSDFEVVDGGPPIRLTLDCVRAP